MSAEFSYFHFKVIHSLSLPSTHGNTKSIFSTAVTSRQTTTVYVHIIGHNAIEIAHFKGNSKRIPKNSLNNTKLHFTRSSVLSKKTFVIVVDIFDPYAKHKNKMELIIKESQIAE